MSLNKRFFSFLAVATVVAAFSTVSFAQEAKVEAPKADTTTRTRQDDMGKAMRGLMMGRIAKGMRDLRALALTDAQKEQLKAILLANKPDKAVFEELRTIHQSRKAGTDLTPEQKARLHAIHDQMRVKAQTVHDQIQNILSVEQKAEIEKRKTEMKGHMEKFRQKGEEFRKQRELKRAKPAPATTEKKDS
jgi:Spy/CpxP family protein refolding chaperone